MKNNGKKYYFDDICGKESLDYVGEYSPHRLFILRFNEDSDRIFDINEEHTEEDK